MPHTAIQNCIKTKFLYLKTLAHTHNHVYEMYKKITAVASLLAVAPIQAIQVFIVRYCFALNLLLRHRHRWLLVLSLLADFMAGTTIIAAVDCELLLCLRPSRAPVATLNNNNNDSQPVRKSATHRPSSRCRHATDYPCNHLSI